MLDTQVYLALNGLVGVNPFLDSVIVFFAQTFAYVLVALFLILVFFFHARKEEKWEFLGVTLFSALLARLGVTEIIRFFVHRPRPFLDLPTHPLLSETSWSFPSGHATFFFGLSTAVYLYNKTWGLLFFAASTLMVLARVAAGVHYVSDVVAGALLGAATALIVFTIAKKLLAKP